MHAFFGAHASRRSSGNSSQNPVELINKQIGSLKNEQQTIGKLIKQWALTLILADEQRPHDEIFKNMAKKLALDIIKPDAKTASDEEKNLINLALQTIKPEAEIPTDKENLILIKKITESPWFNKKKQIFKKNTTLSPRQSGMSEQYDVMRKSTYITFLDEATAQLTSKIERLVKSGFFSKRTNEILEQCHRVSCQQQ